MSLDLPKHSTVVETAGGRWGQPVPRLHECSETDHMINSIDYYIILFPLLPLLLNCKTLRLPQVGIIPWVEVLLQGDVRWQWQPRGNL